MLPRNIGEVIIDAIIRDISDRKGLGDIWYTIDDDTQQEIKNTWINILILGIGDSAQARVD